MKSLQQLKQLELNLGPVADVPPSRSSGEFIASHLSESPTGQIRLMGSICERNNMRRAIKRVIKNKGAPGVDGMTVRQVKRCLLLIVLGQNMIQCVFIFNSPCSTHDPKNTKNIFSWQYLFTIQDMTPFSLFFL